MQFFSSFKVLLILFLGILAVNLFPWMGRHSGFITRGGVGGVLFCMGAKISSDPEIYSQIGRIGGTALVLGAATVAGSVVAVRMVRKLILKEGQK